MDGILLLRPAWSARARVLRLSASPLSECAFAVRAGARRASKTCASLPRSGLPTRGRHARARVRAWRWRWRGFGTRAPAAALAIHHSSPAVELPVAHTICIPHSPAVHRVCSGIPSGMVVRPICSGIPSGMLRPCEKAETPAARRLQLMRGSRARAFGTTSWASWSCCLLGAVSCHTTTRCGGSRPRTKRTITLVHAHAGCGHTTR